MVWRIEFSRTAEKRLAKLDRIVARRIIAFMRERVAVLDNPGMIGEALKGSELGEFWKYRVGDYRLIWSLENNQLVVLVLRVGHRREVYKR